MLKPKKKSNNKAANPQGITASGNALHRVTGIALLVILVPVLLGFAYLLLVRDPQLQNNQINQVSAAYANQQAVNIQQLISRLEDRMESAAKSPLALSAIGDGSGSNIALIEQTMLDYFPEVISLRILPIGDLGTAGFEGGNQGLRNHIEVDLVRRTSNGEETQPESYQFEGNWLTSVSFIVSHPRVESSRAVIIATIENEVIVQELQALGSAKGRSVVQQYLIGPKGPEKGSDIASTGDGGPRQFTQVADIPNTSWKLAFTPSGQLLNSLSLDRMPILGLAGVFLLATLLGIGLILAIYPRNLLSEVDRVISAADRKSPLVLKIPELVSIAKQLRRATLRSLRQSGGAANGDSTGSGSDLANPMFQSVSILDDDESLELDILPSAGSAAETAEDMASAHIYRAYDIRGNAKEELPDELVAKIGGAIATLAKEMDQQAVIVGCDGRASSPRLKACLIKSLMECGRDVIDIGTVPTPLLYFATRHLDCKSGIMVTGSHNPAEDNGFKIVLDQKTIAAGGIQRIRELVRGGKFVRGSGRTIREEIIPEYIDEVVNDIAIAVPLKIVIDAGNGVTGPVAPELFEELGCEVVPLYCDIDGRFPNHPPDTSNEDNLQDLAEMVKQENADFGVAFDGDGDRLAVITASGEIVRSDTLLMIFAQDVVSRNPGADVVFDVKCSRNLSQLITRSGGRPVLWKTGHAFMKEKMLETGALLGGEFSGHMFFGERWYGFDDGMYAAGRLAEILSTLGSSLDEVLAELPIDVSTPEILIPIEESRKFSVMERIASNADFSSGKVNTLDGIRVDYKDGWGLVRASNTTAALTARFEASSEAALEIIKQEFRAQIALVDSDLDLEF